MAIELNKPTTITAACAARVQICPDGQWVDAVAIMAVAGHYDVSLLIRTDTGAIITGDEMSDYELEESRGCVTFVPTGS